MRCEMFLQFTIGIVVHDLNDALREQTGFNENHANIIRHWRSRVKRMGKVGVGGVMPVLNGQDDAGGNGRMAASD